MHEVKCYFVSYVKYNNICHCIVYGDYHSPLYESEFNDILNKIRESDNTDNIVILNYIEMSADK